MHKQFYRWTILLVGSLVLMQNVNAQNQLQNAGFENNPPTTFGNNVSHPITPWVLQGTVPKNVVKVDGGVYNYGNNGPEFDASGRAAGTEQHYLDVVGTQEDGEGFYQSFTPRCSGTVDFGGYFSRRGNYGGTAKVSLYEGVGTGGNIVGQTNNVTVPGGISQPYPWILVAFTAPMTAGTTYSFFVSMQDYLNFDEGFVRFDFDCPTDDPPNPDQPLLTDPTFVNPNDPPPVDPPQPDPITCCPPWDKTRLFSMWSEINTGGVLDPYVVKLVPTPQIDQQFQAFANYAETLNSNVDSMNLLFALQDCQNNLNQSQYQSNCTNPRVWIGQPKAISWLPAPATSPIYSDLSGGLNSGWNSAWPPSEILDTATQASKPNNWYKLWAIPAIKLADGSLEIPENCPWIIVGFNHKIERSKSGGPPHAQRLKDVTQTNRAEAEQTPSGRMMLEWLEQTSSTTSKTWTPRRPKVLKRPKQRQDLDRNH